MDAGRRRHLGGREAVAAGVPAPLSTPEPPLGGVLAGRTNRLFQEARRVRAALPDGALGDHAA
ncbi:MULTISPECIES: hypothetical protein [Streptomyces]|uniref:Uncharacterized protein n=1 Tax=Streptomyces bottropensis TaxID=42235 RepID=A0ABU8AZW9_9ACTN|nr:MULTISPECIES: hypothetical protein [Streptomyces]MZD18263.1 hypothetical protein [Streptomyces sp. SID5476]